MLAAAGTCAAQERYAVIVVGAPGGDAYQREFATLEASLGKAVRERLAFESSHVTVLSGTTTNPSLTSTREHVRAAFDTLRTQVKPGDLVLVLLAGHGTSDGATAKFNLVGPDLDASEWAELVAPLQGRMIFVNATGASFPFLEALSRRNRVVVTATDSSAQRFDTVFAEMFAKALEDPATDLDRNGRISVWEAFVQTSAAVAQYFEQHGQLATEHAMLDDNGDRIGRQAEAPGPGRIAGAHRLSRCRSRCAGRGSCTGRAGRTTAGPRRAGGSVEAEEEDHARTAVGRRVRAAHDRDWPASRVRCARSPSCPVGSASRPRRPLPSRLP